MDLNQFEFINWEKLHQLCFELAQKVDKANLKVNKIVAISRGGLVVARILSDFLDLPIAHISIVAYQEIGKITKPKITEGLGRDVSRNKLLLVDEIVDSGKSLAKGLTYLTKFKPTKIYSAGVIVKPKANPKPDFFVRITNKWAVFPYEVRETTEQLVEKWRKTGKKEKEIENGLEQLGFARELVKEFF